MGYYTAYNLTWKPSNIDVEDFIRNKQIETDGGFAYGIEPDGSQNDAVKWYEHEKDMKILSRRFPQLVFTLSGEGEESGDVWKKYFKNGKMQAEQAKIEIAPFNPEKLK